MLEKIKNRLGKDKSIEAYLVSELTKSGSDVGELLAKGVTGQLAGTTTQKDITGDSLAMLERKQME